MNATAYSPAAVALFERNLESLERMLSKSRSTGKKVNGYTSEELARIVETTRSRITARGLLKIGPKYIVINSLAEAARIWNDVRDVMLNEGLGSSDAPAVNVILDRKGYRISWNGCVWDAATGLEVLP